MVETNTLAYSEVENRKKAYNIDKGRDLGRLSMLDEAGNPC